MSVEDYKKHLEEMKKLIKTEGEKNALKKKNQKKMTKSKKNLKKRKIH